MSVASPNKKKGNILKGGERERWIPETAPSIVTYMITRKVQGESQGNINFQKLILGKKGEKD